MLSTICNMIKYVDSDSKANLAIISVMRKLHVFCVILDDGKIYPVGEFSKGEKVSKTLARAAEFGFIYLKVFEEDEGARIIPISRVKEFTLGCRPIDNSALQEIKDAMGLDTSLKSSDSKINDSLARIHENLMGSEHKNLNNSSAFK